MFRRRSGGCTSFDGFAPSLPGSSTPGAGPTSCSELGREAGNFIAALRAPTRKELRESTRSDALGLTSWADNDP